MTYESQIRATFNDTKKSQEKLRIYLDRLDANDLFVKPDERTQFFELLADSMLGFDSEKECKLLLPDGTYLHIKDVGGFIRYLAYYTDSKVDFNFLKRYGKIDKAHINIGLIWHELKFIVYSIYPEALAMSIRISKEQKKTGGGRGTYVGPKDIDRFTDESF